MKIALITGASTGIGRRYAEQLAAKGHNVLIISNQRELNEEVAAAIEAQYGVRALPLYADLAQVNSAEQIYDFCQREGLEVDILISNAGILQFGQMLRMRDGLVELINALHCTTPAKLCRLFGADMCSRREGRILIMSSITAWTPYPTISLYGATKVYLKSFAQSLWYEFRPYGVKVTTVYPGAVDTPLYKLDDKYRRLFRRLGLMLSPEQLAKSGLRAMFRGSRSCIPGLFAKFVAAVCYLLPAHALLPVLKIPAIKRLLAKL